MAKKSTTVIESAESVESVEPESTVPFESEPNPGSIPSTPSIPLDEDGPAPMSQIQFLSTPLAAPLSPGQIAAAKKGIDFSRRQPQPTPATNLKDFNDPIQSNPDKEAPMKLATLEGEVLAAPHEIIQKISSWLKSHSAKAMAAFRVAEDGSIYVVSELGQKCRFWLDTSEE